MIPLCLVTGFLGSGKTTLMQRVVDEYADRKLAYLVNEFSPKDVDGARLHLPEGELTRIPGGSIFCKCLTGRFIQVLSDLAAAADSEPLDGVVIETSGIANPAVASAMFEETGRAERFMLGSVIVMVDPGSFYKLVRTLPNVRAQVESATRIVINKADLFDEEAIARTRSLIDEIRPGAAIEVADHANVPLDTIFGGGNAFARGGEYAQCRDPNYCQTVLQPGPDVDWSELKRRLSVFGDGLYRVKGCVHDGADMLMVDFSASGWIEEVAPAGGASELVVIAAGHKEPQLEALARQMNAS